MARRFPLWAIGLLAGGLALLGVGAAVVLLWPKASATYAPMTADELIDEWARNPVAAADKYGKNGVELTGVLYEIGSNNHLETFIDVGPPLRKDVFRRTHIFVTSPRATEGLKKARVGDVITVRARASGNVQSYPWLAADEILTR